MRSLAVPFGFLGSAVSLIFWVVLPFVPAAGSTYIHTGNELFYLVFGGLSVAGVVGSLLAAGSSRWAPRLLALAIVPGIAAVFIPGLLLVVATLLSLQEPELRRPRAVR
jgi:hypothetical protein